MIWSATDATTTTAMIEVGERTRKRKQKQKGNKPVAEKPRGKKQKLSLPPKKGKIVNSHGMKNMNFYSEKDMAKAP
jgi:hypothetical protein